MSKLEVLCATMYQKDFSKIKEMNIQSDVIFANQDDRFSYDELNFDGHKAKMVTTAQRGVGKNRNTALLYATGDICLFADDDVQYIDGYPQKIMTAFREVSKADVLVFNLGTNPQEPEIKKHTKIKKLKQWDIGGYGTCRIAFKRSAVANANIWFSTLFGGGSDYLSGEDSLWLTEALRKEIRVYAHPHIIGKLKQEKSSWFSGFNEEYFFSKGAWAQAAWPKLKHVMFLYYLIRLRHLTEIPVKRMIRAMYAGATSFKKGEIYTEWQNES